MRELQSVVAAFERVEGTGVPLVLATVVHVEGSTYRRPGARLLVSDEQWLAGGVSGGCLEGDLLKRAFWRTESGAPVLVEYDSRSDSDSAWMHALGCNGLVEVLLERVDPAARIHPLRTVAGWLRASSAGVLVTVFRAPAPLACVGRRLALAPDGSVADDLPAEVSTPLLAEARDALALRRSKVIEMVAGGGQVEALVEVIAPPPRVVVFGEGPDVPPFIELARSLGWRTTLVVTRHAAAVAPGEAASSEVIVCGADAVRERAPLQGAAAVVLMTHTYAWDRAILDAVLRAPSAAPYIGILGPRRRTEKLLEDLEQDGLLPSESLGRVFSPVGLDLGAEEPEEIALAIVAEIQATLRGRSAGSLRAVDGPIHRPGE